MACKIAEKIFFSNHRYDESSRERKLTEKGLAYQIQRAEVSLQRSMSSWRRQANHVKRLLCDSDDIDCIRKELRLVARHMIMVVWFRRK